MERPGRAGCLGRKDRLRADQVLEGVDEPSMPRLDAIEDNTSFVTGCCGCDKGAAESGNLRRHGHVRIDANEDEALALQANRCNRLNELRDRNLIGFGRGVVRQVGRYEDMPHIRRVAI